MVKVYFESGRHAELVAIFDNESSYDNCSEALEKAAEEAGMIVTESVEGEELDSLVVKAEAVEEKHTYLLLGSDAVEAYHEDGGIVAAEKAFGDVYDFNHTTSSINDLLEAYDGWQNWREITKEEYETYLKIKK